MGENGLGMGDRLRARRARRRPVVRSRSGRGLLALAGLVTLAACAAPELGELEVSGPAPGQPPPAPLPVEMEAETGPQPTGTPDTIPTTTSSTSSTSSTTTPPPTTSTTGPDPDPDPGEGEGDEGEGEGGDGGSASPVAFQADPAAAEASVAFVNQRRAENGLAPLTVDPELRADAEQWGQQMAVEQNMYHDPDRGSKMPEHYGAWGENVAVGGDPGGLDQAWWDSEGHRANILGESYESVGIAFVPDPEGTYWAVQIFGG